MLKLRKILLYDKLFYILLLITFLYLLVYFFLFEVKSKYDINENHFILKVNNYNIDGDKLTLSFDNLVGIYYFELEHERIDFINNIKLGDTLEITGNLNIPNNNTVPNTINYKKYLEHKSL